MTLSGHTNHTAEAKQKDLLDFQAVPESWSGRIGGITAAFVFLGLAGRLIRYLLCFPLWPDETFLAANFLDGKFSCLVGALDYHQVAPLFFLWAEQLIVNILGFTEYALRLFPFLAGLASVILFYRLAAKLTEGSARLLATAIFAVSYYPIRHSAEVKPYSIDLLVSVVFLVLAVEWWNRPKRKPPSPDSNPVRAGGGRPLLPGGLCRGGGQSGCSAYNLEVQNKKSHASLGGLQRGPGRFLPGHLRGLHQRPVQRGKMG